MESEIFIISKPSMQSPCIATGWDLGYSSWFLQIRVKDLWRYLRPCPSGLSSWDNPGIYFLSNLLKYRLTKCFFIVDVELPSHDSNSSQNLHLPFVTSLPILWSGAMTCCTYFHIKLILVLVLVLSSVLGTFAFGRVPPWFWFSNNFFLYCMLVSLHLY